MVPRPAPLERRACGGPLALSKNPIFEESGRRGAEKRWGEVPRVVRMDSLNAAEATIVRSLLELKRARESVVQTRTASPADPDTDNR